MIDRDATLIEGARGPGGVRGGARCSGGAAGAQVSLDYSVAAGPTKFLVGTEGGAVLSCNRKGKTPADRVGTSYPGVPFLPITLRAPSTLPCQRWA